MKLKLISILSIALLFSSCSSWIDSSMNTSPNNPTDVPVTLLVAPIEANLAYVVGGDLARTNCIWMQQIAGIASQPFDLDVYNISESDVNNSWSYNLYTPGMYNTKILMAKAVTQTSPYYAAIAKILMAYQLGVTTDLWGDIPYSNALNGANGQTKSTYDKQQAIYLSCLSDLAWAVNHFNATSTTQFSFGSAEFLFGPGNNIDKWKAFANSLRLRYALTMYDKDNADAAPIIADALTKPLLTDPVADVVGLSQANVPDISFDIDGAGRGFFFRQESRARMGSTLWNLFSSNNNNDGSGIFDLRCKIFFEVNGNGNWVPYPQNPVTPISDGGDPYKTDRDADWTVDKVNNLYSDYNYYWGRDGNISGSTGACPEIFMSAAETYFLKAEAYARGAGVAQNSALAKTAYEAGVTASLTFWKNMAFNSSVWVVNKPASATPTSDEINAVLTNPKVAWDANNALSLIYAQEWIDLFRQPWVAWALLRRTGGATPMDPSNPAGYTQNYGSLQRYQYPGDEQALNNANWKAATGGNDLTSTKIWITK